MSGIIIYLTLAVLLYVYLKIKCAAYIKIDGEEISPMLQEIIIILICLLWIIFIPLLYANGKIKHE